MYDLLNQALSSFAGYSATRVPAVSESLDLSKQRIAAMVSLSPTEELTSRLRRAGYSHIHNFIVLPSRDAPRWLLPHCNPCVTQMGTQLYGPCTKAGRIIKGAFLRLIRTGWNGWRKALIASKEPLPLETLVTELTGESSPIFALSLGRQPAVRKLTVQVMRPTGEVLGYIKIPLTPLAATRVCHEATVLERLWNFPVLRPHIPRLLYAGTWSDTYVLFQSPLMGDVGTKSFARMHDQFLEMLRSIHSVNRSGHHLIERVASTWNRTAPLLGARWETLGQAVLRRSASDLSSVPLPYGLMHGDFTPWNIRTRDQQLFLFDWESADWESPVVWDKFHFQVQTGFLLNKSQSRASNVEANGFTGSLYLLYLLNSVSQFVEEQNQDAISYREKLIARYMSTEAAKPSKVQ